MLLAAVLKTPTIQDSVFALGLKLMILPIPEAAARMM
jgi:hypothetical protein